VGGYDNNLTNRATWFVGQFHSDGTPVPTFGASNGSGMTSGCYLSNALCSLANTLFAGMALQPDGHIVVLSAQVLTRLTSTASALDTSGVVGGNGYAAIGGLQINSAKGTLDDADGVTQLASGKWLVSGQGRYMQGDAASTFVVVRLNTDLSLDTSFNAQTDSNNVTFAGGQVVLFPGGGGEATAQVKRALVQGDGRIVLVGSVDAGSGSMAGVARLNSDGTHDLTYGGGGTGQAVLAWSGGSLLAPPSSASAKLDASGRLLFAASASPTATGITGIAIVRVLDDGTLDSGFGNKGVSYQLSPLCTGGGGYALTFDSAGRIVAAGYCFLAGGVQEFLITRVRGDDGTLDTGFGFGGFSHGSFSATSTQDFVDDIAIDSTGRPVFGGVSYPGSAASMAAVGRVTYDLIHTNGFESAPRGCLPPDCN
jgi:uncharacterized delta-60 repeat protein